MPAVSDAERLSALRRMKTIALVLLLLAALVFAVSFALQQQFSWLGYVRSAAEGAMVGALADWFAVTALFRHPLGLPIPHTAIIPNRKDEIGASLGAFVEHEFLSDEVVLRKVRSIKAGRIAGEWLAEPRNATRLTADLATAATAILELLADDDVEQLLDQLARRHIFGPEWAPIIGRVGARLVSADQQRSAVDAVFAKAEEWLTDHPEAFGSMVSDRLPKWLPGVVNRFVDDKAHREILAFVRAVREQPNHSLRIAIDRYLADLTDAMQNDPTMIARIEQLKLDLLDSPRVREAAREAWTVVKQTLSEALADPESELRLGVRQAVIEIGTRLAKDDTLQQKVDAWVTDAAAYLVRTYRHDIAGVITETVERWDARETTQKLELQIGRDLQFIRINGTVVGALAGLSIYAIATAIGGLHLLG